MTHFENQATGHKTPNIERTEQLFATWRTAIRTGGWCFTAYMAAEAITALAGQSTNVAVTATLSLLADLKFVLSITLAGAATAWALAERNLRHRKVEQMQGRIRALETACDPGRTSSELTPKGKTNPKDIKP
jgi:hypothetical protein